MKILIQVHMYIKTIFGEELTYRTIRFLLMCKMNVSKYRHLSSAQIRILNTLSTRGLIRPIQVCLPYFFWLEAHHIEQVFLHMPNNSLHLVYNVVDWASVRECAAVIIARLVESWI